MGDAAEQVDDAGLSVSFGASIVMAEFALRRSTDWLSRAMSARLLSCTRTESPGQNVSSRRTGCHCGCATRLTSTVPCTEAARAGAGSHDGGGGRCLCEGGVRRERNGGGKGGRRQWVAPSRSGGCSFQASSAPLVQRCGVLRCRLRDRRLDARHDARRREEVRELPVAATQVRHQPALEEGIRPQSARNPVGAEHGKADFGKPPGELEVLVRVLVQTLESPRRACAAPRGRSARAPADSRLQAIEILQESRDDSTRSRLLIRSRMYWCSGSRTSGSSARSCDHGSVGTIANLSRCNSRCVQGIENGNMDVSCGFPRRRAF
ncbi:MAG: hypothetical protein MZV65_18655 [Chromatiales bacterium]|nr:hypothetical protein [Chromatiales bacterium]